jgi:hypothetical protein
VPDKWHEDAWVSKVSQDASNSQPSSWVRPLVVKTKFSLYQRIDRTLVNRAVIAHEYDADVMPGQEAQGLDILAADQNACTNATALANLAATQFRS